MDEVKPWSEAQHALEATAYEAVREVIRTFPGSAERNAVVWRGVMAYGAVVGPELERLHKENAELDRAVSEEIDERDRYHDLLDKFACTIAPISVIGEHSSGNDPWANALDMATPDAEVERLIQRAEQAEAERDAARADAKQWHDTYQQHMNDGDEFLGELLDLLPGARDTGSDAYDQIPRGIERLRERAEQAEAKLENAFKLLDKYRETTSVILGQRDALKVKIGHYEAYEVDVNRILNAKNEALGRAEAAIERVRVARANARSSMGRVYDYVKGSDLDAALATPTQKETTDGR